MSNFCISREITGFLVMYRVYGLRTLEHMFPNLAVIRGDELILHYAFMLFEMNELTEVIAYLLSFNAFSLQVKIYN